MAADDRKDGPGPRDKTHSTTVPSGTRIVGGTYEVERLLKAGGMGEVYRGRNVFNGEPVAIKIVLSSQSSDETHTKLFEREALVLSKLAHEAIVRYYVYTVDPIIGRPCLVMEFVAGPSLLERMAEGPMPIEDVRTVMRRVASGLGAAHKRGVIHRDLSPDNVILEDGLVEHAKLIDFGIAKAGAALGQATMLEGRIAGKYNYMAPEQLGLADGVVDERADIYSLGLVCIGMFRGTALNMGENPFEAITRRQSVPDISAVPDEMKPLVARMLAPNPSDRPDTMIAVVKMLDDPNYVPAPAVPRVTAGGTVIGGKMPTPPPAAVPAAGKVSAQTTTSNQTPTLLPEDWNDDDLALPGAAASPAEAEIRQDATVIQPKLLRPAAPASANDDDDERTVFRPKGDAARAEPPRDQTVMAEADQGDILDMLGGSTTAPPKQSPASTPAQKPKAAAGAERKSSSLPLIIGGVVALAIAGGGAFFMMKGGVASTATTASTQTTKPATTDTTKPATTKPATTQTAAETAAPPVTPAVTPAVAVVTVKDVRHWLATTAKGKCLYVRPSDSAAGTAPQLAALTAQPDVIKALTADFTTKFTTIPKIAVTSVLKSQCAVLEFATIRDDQAEKPADLVIETPDSTVKGGTPLRGTVTGSAGRTTALFIISASGGVAQLGSYIRPGSQGDAHFDIPVTLAPGSAASDALLLAVTTDKPVEAFATLPDGYTADTVMPRLALWLQDSKQTADIAVQTFRLEP